MNDLVAIHFQKLERSKEKVLELLASKKAEEITWNDGASWSMVQAMRHVMISEKMSLAYLRKKSLAGDQLKERPLLPRLSLLLLFSVFLFRFKFKAPKILASPEVTSLDELRKDWDALRTEMEQFFTEFPDKWLTKAVYKHPFLGMLNAVDALRFFNAHLMHHIRQVHRIESKLRKSGVGGSK